MASSGQSWNANAQAFVPRGQGGAPSWQAVGWQSAGTHVLHGWQSAWVNSFMHGWQSTMWAGLSGKAEEMPGMLVGQGGAGHYFSSRAGKGGLMVPRSIPPQQLQQHSEQLQQQQQQLQQHFEQQLQQQQ